MKELIWKSYFDKLPLTDRVTHYYELWTFFFIGIFMGAGLSLVSIIARKIGMSSTGITVMLSMQFFGYLFSLYFGHHINKRAKMPFVFWPAVTSKLLVCAIAVFFSPRGFLVIMCLYYFISTIPASAYASIMRTNYSEGNRGKLMSNIRIIRTIVSTACAFGAGFALDKNPEFYRWMLPAAAAFGIVGSLMFRKLKVRRDIEPRGISVTFRQTLGVLREDKAFLIYLTIIFFCAGPPKLLIPLEPIRYVDELHFNYKDAGLILGTLNPIASILGFILWSRLIKRFHPLYLLVALFTIGLSRYAIIALATEPQHIIPASMLHGFSTAGFELIPLFAMIRFAKERISLYFALHSTLVGIRGIIGPFIGNFLYSGLGLPIVSIFWGAYITSMIGVAAMFVFAVFWTKHEARAAAAVPV